MSIKKILMSILLGPLTLSGFSEAAVSLDRTRIIFDGENKSISLNINNNNKQLPYLAQGWIENEESKKITSPLIVLPPVQRLEPGKSSQMKIEALPDIKNLPQDRESLFYFNMREIPPKSDKPNTLQIALQTKIKLFYRPEAIAPQQNSAPWQEKLLLEKKGNLVFIKNPTPYYVTIINAGAHENTNAKEFNPIMIAPFSENNIGMTKEQLGNTPVITYINDYGGRPKLTFDCKNTICTVINKN
ncbi:fimbria/pilus periplasmic chaperone [Providencia rettgeri]|uniref:fimbria/pilus periplasmic chaperone n=1 Tax=Providencia TaxID=586 RepID=UPI0022732B67|nr:MULTISPECIES: fimbria/pilus periplasmic chaperone [unclassified Providencia]MDB9568937.1 fimbria/pilus periplasmic chaperone [Providencia rettgeri]WOB89351.1 fimbria/pilus periplasmic chaperone [Providencia sp. PROV175]